MSRNMFAPNSNYLNNSYLRKLLRNYNDKNLKDNDQILKDYDCTCFKEKVNKANLAYNDSTRTSASRVSQLTRMGVKGRIIFGNYGIPAETNYLGGIDGQPNGIPTPIRNKF
jgi:hypothetical protein